MKRVKLNSSKAVKRGSSTSIDSVGDGRGRGRGRGRGVTSSTMNNSSSSSQMQVDSVGVGESATPTPVPSMGGSQATEASTGEEEENHEMTEEEYLAYLKDNERSDIWAHFTRKMVKNRVKGVCIYCSKEYCVDPYSNGTTSLLKHIDKCTKYPPNIEMLKAKKQKILCFNKETRELETSALTNEELTRLCVEMIILDELPFTHVDGIGFKRFMQKALPFWKIPCRQTIAKDVLKVYMWEKEKLMGQMKGKRVCLTTDTWTSIQNINYMVVTAHFIDDDWVLHKRVLNFCVIEDHKGESIAEILEDCLLEWGIEKILTITVDNASANDVAIRELIKKLDAWGDPRMILNGGKNVHMRCVAHILNLIVNDGLKPMNMSIDAIRNAVRYVRSSPQRLELFKQCVERVKIECKGLVVLDVPTRWNSTYLMLESALKFQKAFDRLSEQDTRNYCAYFKLGEKNAKEGPPACVDWRNAEVYSDFLKPFYEVTLRVCCSNVPIIHHTFGDLLYLYGLLEEQIKKPSVPKMRDIAPPMGEKYKKYWGDFDELNQYVFLALILDPRHKFEKLVDYLEVVFGDEDEYHRVEVVSISVKELLYDIYNVYEEEEKDVRGVGECQVSNDMIKIPLATGVTEFERKLKEKELKRKAKKAEIINNDVDRYISDPIEGDDEGFDLLNWWRVNGVSRYPILTRIAKDILAIPVSTISSESSFSTSGRVINPHRSSLSPKMVQALICTQSWLRGETIALNHVPSSEEIELCEEAEKEILEMPSLSSKQNVKCGMLPPKMKVMKQTTLRG